MERSRLDIPMRGRGSIHSARYVRRRSRGREIEKKSPGHIRFVEQALKALKIAHVRRYHRRYDPKKYGVCVHVVLFVLTKTERKDEVFQNALKSVRSGL